MNELCNYRFVRAGEVHHDRVIIKEDIIHKLLCLSVYEDSLPVPATYIYIYIYIYIYVYIYVVGSVQMFKKIQESQMASFV